MLTLKFAKKSLLACAALAACSQLVAQTALPAFDPSLALATPDTTAPPRPSRVLTGPVQVAVRLTDAPLALAVGANAKRLGTSMTLAQRQAYVASLKSKQDAVMSQIARLGGTEAGRLSKVYNAVVVNIDAAKLPAVVALPGVSAVKPIIDHQLSLTNTVPHVGASTLHTLGLTGTGIKIAVLDSGIDYTHKNLGGSGSVADFATAAAAAAGAPPAALFPTAKVIGGYDFVGENWPNSPTVPDANPIDAGPGSSHGTHVADIAAGASLDGTHKGVAPGAQLYAVKVCSSVSTSCNGLAILQGLEWSMDPKGDLSFDGAADIVNLSLGASYGQRENPSTEAVSNLVRFGIVAAVAAGNAGDRPYIVSSPSNAAEAISVAQTAMPNARALALVVNAPASIAGTYGNTNTLDWAPVTSAFTGPLKRGSTTAQLEACALADTPDFTDAVAYVDRGTCSISFKVSNAKARGARGVVIGNNVAGDAPSFSNGGFAPGTSEFAPSIVVSQAIALQLKTVASGAATVTVDPAVSISLAGSMASTSARGPGYNYAAIKPEIGAPGASVSAVNGTGNGESGFGGTSGATPVIAGSAALLLQKFPSATPPEIKSRLMNSAEKTVYTNAATLPGQLAPITRIGSGEVRVNQAANVTAGVWDSTNPYSVSLAFGAPRVSSTTTLSKKVAVRNYSNSARTFSITRSFRYANDAANGAVTLSAPATVSVPANGTGSFVLTMSIDPSKLPAWNLFSGSTQGTGALLQAVEYDGFVTVSDGTDTVSTPWHVLPHRSANVTAATSLAMGGAASAGLPVSNLSAAQTGTVDVFALTGTSPQDFPTPPAYGGGQALIDLRAVGVRPVDVGALGLQFGITTFGSRAHPAYPAEFDVYVDADNDGADDYVIYNVELTGFGATGQTVVRVQNLNTGTTTTRFYAAADLNSSNMIYTVLASDVGITSPTQKFRFSVYAFDNYFSGQLTDGITNMVHTLGTPRYASTLGDSLGVPVGFSGSLPVNKPAGGATASPSQNGLLMLYRDARSGREADVVTITP
jgi:subtilisin family serine protease